MSLLYSESKTRLRNENALFFQFQNYTSITVKKRVFHQTSTKKWVTRVVYISVNLHYDTVEIRVLTLLGQETQVLPSRNIPIQLTNWTTAMSLLCFLSRKHHFWKRSIGRFVERHLLIGWCLKPAKKYISTKTLYNLIYALLQFFWNRPTDPMGFSFKQMFDHQALEEWMLSSASSKYCWGCAKPHLPEPADPYLESKLD